MNDLVLLDKFWIVAFSNLQNQVQLIMAVTSGMYCATGLQEYETVHLW